MTPDAYMHHPVSYTHLDVYKRQCIIRLDSDAVYSRDRSQSILNIVEPGYSKPHLRNDLTFSFNQASTPPAISRYVLHPPNRVIFNGV